MERTKEPPSRLIYCFGPFQLDPTERRLVRDGRELRLPPKVFETLVVLVRRHGLLVEKDDLMKFVWPGMLVEEVTLAGNISLLRKALGDAPGQDDSRYIETVSKRGYRLIAKVTEVEQPVESSSVGLQEAEALSVAPDTPSKDGWQKRRAWIALPGFALLLGAMTGAPAVTGRGSRADRIAWGVAGVLLGALVTMGIGYSKFKNAASAPTVVRFTIQPPADHQFAVLDVVGSAPAVSPDGKQLVSPVRDTQGKVSLWVRGLDDAGEGRMLPGTEDAADPFWSPDGRSIGFFAEGRLKRIESDGSSLQTLCDAGGRGGAWSPDGIILFTLDNFSPLYEIRANGGSPRQITKLNRDHGEASHRWPVFLTDGRHFLFFVASIVNPEINGVYSGSLDSQDYHMVVRTFQGPAFEARGTILYVRDGAFVAQPFDEWRLVTTGEPTVLPDRVGFRPGGPGASNAWFSASRTGVLAYFPATPGGSQAVTWYDRDGKRGDALDAGNLCCPVLSPDGTQAVVTIVSNGGLGSDLWSFDLSRGTKTRLTSGPGYKQEGIWQPDGRFVMFASILKDAPHISRIKSDGTGAVETVLETAGVSERPGSVCRDGRYLVYQRTPTGSLASIWILPLTGDRKPFALVQSQFWNGRPAFSPDCKWVAYVSNETGQAEVYITHFPDAAHRYQVSTQGGMVPRWRSDGKELFYDGPPNSMIAVNVDEKAEEISLGSPRTLFHLADDAGIYGPFGVAADGRRFLIVETNSPSGTVPLTLVLNWDAELKKR